MIVYFSTKGKGYGVFNLKNIPYSPDEVIIKICEYAMEEGISIESIISELLNLNYNDIVKYMLDKYINEIDMNKMYDFLGVQGLRNWSKIVLNQI